MRWGVGPMSGALNFLQADVYVTTRGCGSEGCAAICGSEGPTEHLHTLAACTRMGLALVRRDGINATPVRKALLFPQAG